MYKLILMELFKETKKKTFMISIILIILTSFLVVYFVNKSEYKENNFNIITEKLDKKEFEKQYPLSSYRNYELRYNEYIEIMKNNIKLESYGNLSKTKYIFEQTKNIQVFLIILIVVIASSTLSNEFSKGTIKTMVISPHKRWHIILSKLICLILIIIALNLILLCSMTIFTMIFTKTNVFLLREYVVINNVVESVNYFFHFVTKYFINILPHLFICILSMFISMVFNGMLSNTFGIILCLSGNLFSQILFGINMKFVQYTFLPYLDFSIFNDKTLLIINNMELGININLKSGILILTISTLVLYFFNNINFCKKRY